jgi:hypothetical protein
MEAKRNGCGSGDKKAQSKQQRGQSNESQKAQNGPGDLDEITSDHVSILSSSARRSKMT